MFYRKMIIVAVVSWTLVIGVTKAFAETSTLNAMCHWGCSENPSDPFTDCTNTSNIASNSPPQGGCQMKSFCTVTSYDDGTLSETCTSWVADIDLGVLGVTDFTQSIDDGPRQPADGDRYQIISKGEMSARSRQSQVRQILIGSSVDLEPYEHIYAADNHFMWLLCEVDTNGNDTICDLLQPPSR